jgi:drug/metabolite transporter (DMT)-like permease
MSSDSNSDNYNRPPPKGYWKMSDEEYYKHYRNASAAYYLLPIFLTWIGSIIIFLLLRDEDPRKAKKGAILGIILTVVFSIIGFLSWAAIIAAMGGSTNGSMGGI